MCLLLANKGHSFYSQFLFFRVSNLCFVWNNNNEKKKNVTLYYWLVCHMVAVNDQLSLIIIIMSYTKNGVILSDWISVYYNQKCLEWIDFLKTLLNIWVFYAGKLKDPSFVHLQFMFCGIYKCQWSIANCNNNYDLFYLNYIIKVRNFRLKNYNNFCMNCDGFT